MSNIWNLKGNVALSSLITKIENGNKIGDQYSAWNPNRHTNGRSASSNLFRNHSKPGRAFLTWNDKYWPIHSRYTPHGAHYLELGHSALISILGKGTEAHMCTMLYLKYPFHEKNKFVTIQAVKCITIPAETLSPVVVVIFKYGPKKARATQRILPEKRVYEIRANVPFQLLVMRFSKKPVVLHRCLCIRP